MGGGWRLYAPIDEKAPYPGPSSRRHPKVRNAGKRYPPRRRKRLGTGSSGGRPHDPLPRPRHLHSVRLGITPPAGLGGPLLAPQPDRLLEAAHAEDEDERREADPEGEQADRDLLAHRVCRHGGRARGAREHLHEQRLRHPRPLGRERHRCGHRVHPEHQQHVPHRAAYAERLEQHPERREAEDPARELHGEHVAQVAAPVAQDREALLDAIPECPHAGTKERERDERSDRQRRQEEQGETRVAGEVGQVEGVQLREVGRLGEHALREGEEEDQRAHREVEARLHEEAGAHGGVARPRYRAAGEEEAHDVAAASGHHGVEAVAGEVGAPDGEEAEALPGIGGAQDVVARASSEAQVDGEEQAGEHERARPDRRQVGHELVDRVEERPE